jgi:hypothetical protein
MFSAGISGQIEVACDDQISPKRPIASISVHPEPTAYATPSKTAT